MKNSNYKLRNISEKDYEFIYQVKKAAFQKYVEMNWGSWNEEQQRGFFESFIATYKEGAFIITHEGNDIGFYNGNTSVDGKYEVCNVCIIPEYQRRGIGTAILRDILSEYADKEIHIQYFKQNPVGRLYERLGFRLSGETAHHYQMVKAIQIVEERKMDTYAVVLYFDEFANGKLKEIMKAISEISGNNYMIDVNIPPHITIGSFLSAEPERLMSLISSFVENVESFNVIFDKIKAFEPRVLYASPIKNVFLKKSNLMINELLLNDFAPADNDYYTPTKWIPHCALAVRLDEEQFDRVRNVVRQTEISITAKIQKIALARCNPYREIEAWKLQ